jgi:hypothetical protein
MPFSPPLSPPLHQLPSHSVDCRAAWMGLEEKHFNQSGRPREELRARHVDGRPRVPARDLPRKFGLLYSSGSGPVVPGTRGHVDSGGRGYCRSERKPRAPKMGVRFRTSDKLRNYLFIGC